MQLSLQQINSYRSRMGFLTVEELLTLNRNIILDPFSTLISSVASIGTDNIFYPNIVIEVRTHGAIHIGNNNTFYPETYIVSDGGSISIGNSNQFGDGGVRIKANRPGAIITVGNYGRYINGAQVLGCSIIADGTQIIGPVTVEDCELEAGLSFMDPSVEQRGAVIKGFGLVRKMKIEVGKVLNVAGDTCKSQIESQRRYHP